jgi:uncharacterized surface protein with fasciclin (FAS1) repeats
MLRTRLLTATAAVALMAAPAFAQDVPQDATTSAPDYTQDMSTDPMAQDTVTQDTTMATQAQAEGTVVDQLRASGNFETLLTALEAAQLTSVLESEQGITIFAPTDDAFAALPPGELERLTQPENAQELRQLLLYHVINADVSSDMIVNRRGAVATAAGSEVLLDGADGTIRADAATVTQADIRAGNGAVFAIDTVLNPASSMAAMGDAEVGVSTEAEAEAEAEAGATGGAALNTETATEVDASLEVEREVDATGAVNETISNTPVWTPGDPAPSDDAGYAPSTTMDDADVSTTPPVDEPTDEEPVEDPMV